MQTTEQMPSFYWYDYETFGLDRRSDRPAQFAGLRTDFNLEPQNGDEGDLWYAKPATDYLPKPESCLLTGIVPQECEEKGICEAAFAGAVWDAFNEPKTVSIGYNSLGFDDEVSRFLFWRNFLDPYSHQWKNDCSRWDLFPLMCALWTLRPEGIVWPRWEDIDQAQYPMAQGKSGVCFKLEFLSKANGIHHSHAHDALSDVYATIGLARLVKAKQPRFWQWAFDNRTKDKITAALAQGPVVWISPTFGQKKGFIKIAQIVGTNSANKNEVFMWDLMSDPDMLVSLSAKELKERLFARKGELPEEIEPLPISRLQLNKAPFICSNLKVLSAERATMLGIDWTTVRENAQKLTALVPMLQGAFSAASEKEERHCDVDVGLYDGGFPSRADTERMTMLKETAPELLAQWIQDNRIHFDDPRFNELLFRYRARNWPETLSGAERERWRAFCESRLMTGAHDARSIDEYFEEIDQLQAQGHDDERSQAILEALYAWGERLGEGCSA